MKKPRSHTQQPEHNVFRLLRIARDIKVKDLAETLAVTPAYINAIESGKRYPSDRLLRDYAAALNVKPETLQNFHPEEHQNERFEQILLWILKLICSTDASQ